MFSICLFESQKGFQICLLSLSPTKAINLPLLTKPNHILMLKSYERAQRPEEFASTSPFLPSQLTLWPSTSLSKSNFREQRPHLSFGEIVSLKDMHSTVDLPIFAQECARTEKDISWSHKRYSKAGICHACLDDCQYTYESHPEYTTGWKKGVSDKQSTNVEQTTEYQIMARNIEHGNSGKTGEVLDSVNNKQQVSILAVISLGTLELHHPLFLEEYLVAYIIPSWKNTTMVVP